MTDIVIDNEKQGPDPNRRRVRLSRLSLEAFAHTFLRGDRKLLRVKSPIPVDAECRGCWRDQDNLVFAFTHPSFDEVAEGGIAPEIKGTVVFEWLDKPDESSG